jgi:hypothetical protein
MAESRKWTLPIVVGAVLCSVMLALVTVSVGHIEYHQAKWTHFPRSLPALAGFYREVYWAGWLLPVMTALIGFVVTTRKLVNVTVIACCISALAVAHVGWFLFFLLALYLTNQTFVAGN